MKIFVGILFWIFIRLFKVMKNIQALFFVMQICLILYLRAV